ncbi:MAG: hypothetical protein ACI8S6_006018 [Myxococcota bacterium]|jgi:hypothetical protein
MARMTLSEKDMDALIYHYTGNCFSCERCGFYEAVSRGDPGAAEAYARYMKEKRGEEIRLVPAK